MGKCDELPIDRRGFLICHQLSWQRAVAAIVASAGVVGASAALAGDGSIPSWEREIFAFINGWPDWLRAWMWTTQLLGALFAPIVVGAAVFLITRSWWHLAAFFSVAPLKIATEEVVKGLFERPRPFVSIGPDINLRGPAIDGLSFPSGHATTAFAVAILMAAFLPPRWRPVPFVWAVLVAVARVYLGEHNPLDVVAGAALGSLVAVIVWFTYLNRHVDPRCDCVTP